MIVPALLERLVLVHEGMQVRSIAQVFIFTHCEIKKHKNQIRHSTSDAQELLGGLDGRHGGKACLLLNVRTQRQALGTERNVNPLIKIFEALAHR